MSINESIYIIMFSSGFFGGLGHCIGMCGPIVASYSLTIKNNSMSPHIFYNLGRITTYTLLGGIAGMTGSLIGIAGKLHGLQQIIKITAGALIVIMGLGLAGWLPFTNFLKTGGNLFSRFISRVKAPSGTTAAASFYPVGIFMGFLPCGLIYTALAAAIRTTIGAENHFYGLIEGSLIMLAFGLGTMPSLLLFGKIINMISTEMRTKLYRLSAVMMILLGIVFIIKS